MPAQSDEAQYLVSFAFVVTARQDETEQYYGMRTDKCVGGIPVEGCEGEVFPVMKPSVAD
jgi:hypothetical protein